MNVYLFVEAEAEQPQRQTGVRAAEGLPFRLHRRGRRAVTSCPARCRTERQDHRDPRRTPPRPTAHRGSTTNSTRKARNAPAREPPTDTGAHPGGGRRPPSPTRPPSSARTSSAAPSPSIPTSPPLDTRWCGDITYIDTWQGWLYLATVIDLVLRRVVGGTTVDHLRTDLVTDALTDAVSRRRTALGVIFHSDRGCQHTSTQANLARDLGVTLSVGRGQCWDNAVAESFFATLKTELVHRRAWPTHKAATSVIFNYIGGWFNTRRCHSTLAYLSPATYEPPSPPLPNR